MQVLLYLCLVICLCSADMDLMEDGSGEGFDLSILSSDLFSTSSSSLVVIIQSSQTTDDTAGPLMPLTSDTDGSSLLITSTSSSVVSFTISSDSSTFAAPIPQSSGILLPQSSSLMQFTASSSPAMRLSPSTKSLPSQSAISSLQSQTTASQSNRTPSPSQTTVQGTPSQQMQTSTSPQQVTSSQTYMSTIMFSSIHSTAASSASLLSSSSSIVMFPRTSSVPTPIIRSSSTLSTSIHATPTPIYGRVPIVTDVIVLNATALSISWTPVADSIGYIIYLKENRNLIRRQANEEISIKVNSGEVTSHVIGNLKPFTSYSVSMASLDINGTEGSRSPLTEPTITGEATPSSPRNVTQEVVENSFVLISWLPPKFPNGIITSYTVILIFVNGSKAQYSVPGNQTMLSISRPGVEFSVTVLASNGAGDSSPQNGTTVNQVPVSDDTLSPGVVAIIVVLCVLMILLIVAAILTIILVWARRWYKYHGGADINVDEIEYKAGDLAEFENNNDIDGQLTAKRWMRENANYSVPSLLLPPISELVNTYKTAEDLVEAKTIVRPQGASAVLQTIGETSSPTNEQPLSANSSSERSCEAPSTLSSVCSAKGHQETNRNFQQPQHHQPVIDEETASSCIGRDSRLLSDDQALFEMMENVYLASPEEMDSLKDLEVPDISSVDVKEQVGLGQFAKVMRGVIHTSSSIPKLQKGDEVAVKILNDDADAMSRERFLGVAYIMSQFDHKNILSLLGVITNSYPLMALFTYATLGDLKHFLTRVRRQTRLESQPCNFGLHEQLFMSCQIASGMEYLASKFYVHRALQAKYVLLSEDYTLKIGGFRISHALAQPGGYFEMKMAGLLPVKWLAMETLENGKFSSNTDLWSFGVLLWEIFAFGLTPFRGVNNEDVLQHLKNGKRLNKPSGCPDDIYAIMLHCWVENARERPSFSTLQTHLLSYYNNLKKEPTASSTSDGGVVDQSPVEHELVEGENGVTQIVCNESSFTQSESDSLSADNSRAALLPPEDQHTHHQEQQKRVNDCDLILTALSNGSRSNGMELSTTSNAFNNEGSLTSPDTNGHEENELYTKL